MSEDALISVIVPVYKVERYLNKCLDSIVNQTYTNLEIILVDDGSPDGCSKMCDEWGRKDSRIKVIHKENAGLGLARNSGLEIATGSYVAFIDSDDFIDLNMMERLYEELVKQNADTVYCGLCRYNEEGNVIKVPMLYSGESFSDDEIIEKILLRMMGNKPENNSAPTFFMSVWHGLYSMSIIKAHSICFPSERVFMSEDLAFHIDYLQHSQRVYVLSDCLYFYRVTQGSLSLAYDKNRFDRIKSMHLQTVEKLNSFLEEKRYQQIELGRFLNLVGGQIYSVVRRNEKNMLANVRKMVSDKMVQECLHTYEYNKNPSGKRLFNFLMDKEWVVLLIFMVRIKNVMMKIIWRKNAY